MTESALKPGSDHLDIADVERRVKAIFIGSVGNLVEWYDFYAFGVVGTLATVPILMTLKETKSPFIAFSGMIFLSLLIYSTMRDTEHESAMHRHE